MGVLVLFFLILPILTIVISIVMYVKCRRIGTLLAMATLVAALLINLLLINIGADFLLLSGELVLYVLVLLPISVCLCWFLRGKKRVVAFVISALLLQELLLALLLEWAHMNRMAHQASGYECMEFMDVTTPIMLVWGMFFWGLVFDFVRNRSERLKMRKEVK